MKYLSFKKLKLGLILLILIICKSNTYAQDTLFLKSDTAKVIVKIIEVNPSDLRYKKLTNLDGPVYTIEKKDIKRVVYRNGEIEDYALENIKGKQESPDLIPGSKVFLTYAITEGEGNVNGNDATGMLRDYIEGKTSCGVVNSVDEADFIIELRVIQKFMGDRSAKISIQHIVSNKIIYESKWVRGSATAFYGYSSTRAAVGKLVKFNLYERFPNIFHK